MSVRHLLIVPISQAERSKLIMDKLNEIYLQNPNLSAYMAFKEFYSYKRVISININDFLVHYKFFMRNYKNLV